MSTTQTEYVVLSHSMRELIPFIGLVEELNVIFDKDKIKPKVKCRLFEDNNGALESTKTPKNRPCTKYIALTYHHFSNFVKEGRVEILQIETTEQITDIFTNPWLLL